MIAMSDAPDIPRLEIQGLTKSFPGVKALDNVSIALYPGKVTALIGENGDLLALSGDRNPYRASVGAIERGALADILVVEGNPLEDISLIADPDRNMKLIMKDGRVFKNELKA